MTRRAFDRFMLDLEIGRNLKVGRLTDSEFRAFVAGILPIAAKSTVRGALLVGELPATADDVARQAGTTKRPADSAMRKLRALGCLEMDDELGAEWVHDFQEWNPEPKRDDTSAERARAYRERKRAERDASRGVTRDDRDASATVTPPEVEGEEEEPSLRSDKVAADGDRGVEFDAARKRLQVEQVEQVWTAYDETRRSVLGARSAAKLTGARRQLVASRLRDWPVEDLVDAVRGWQHFPHNRGENDRGTAYCDLELVLRDAARIERFRDAERDPATRPHLRPVPSGGMTQEWKRLGSNGGAA